MKYLSTTEKITQSIKKMAMVLWLTSAGATMAHAQETKLIDVTQMTMMKMEKLDSMYNYWNDFVAQHPKDEVAWRNLFEVENGMVEQTHWKNWNAGEELRKKLNVVGRMKQVIPDTYTFYYSAYEGAYREEAWTSDEFFAHRNEYADAAIASIPDNAIAHDYDLWAGVLIQQLDTVRLTKLLTSYYESGQYPPDALQYHFNELQGMEEGGIFIGAHEGDIVGKLILQLVKGVHRDKILYDENRAVWKEHVGSVFRRIGLDFNDALWEQLWSPYQEKSYPAIFRYICEHAKRPIYVSAASALMINLGAGIPKELQPHFYNEGLTLRYSAKPYDNRAVKRRNIETRYWLEYLRMSFQPPVKASQQHFAAYRYYYATNYIELLRDQLPYYKEHNPERYAWLKELLTTIHQQLEEEGFGVEDLNLD